MSGFWKLACAMFLGVLALPAIAAPQIRAVVTSKGVRLESLGGGAQMCTISVRYSFLREGERKTDTVECAGILTPLTSGPICARNLTRATDIRIESPVTTVCR